MKKAISLALALTLAVSFAACGGGGGGGNSQGGGGSESDVIKIGVFEPLTGGNAGGGELEVRGIELAHEKYGEVLGKKIELVKADNKSDAVEASVAASRLVESEKVDIVIGSWGSTLSNAGGPIFKENKIVCMGASCTNPNVTNSNEYYYRVCFIDPFQGTVLANYAFNDLGAKNVAIIFESSNDYAVGLKNFFEEAFKELGGTISSTSTYQLDDTDFSSQLQAALANNPDCIFAPGNFTEAALMMQQARQTGSDIQFLGGDTFEVPELITIGGDAVEGCAITSFFDPAAPINDTTTEFIEAYRAKYNEEPAAFAALGYDAYVTVYKAIEAAGSVDSDAIRDALSTIVVPGATGNIRFNDKGDAIINLAVLKVVKDGKFEYLSTVTID
ncbi:MAG: ABC transporter substrate-binding protein [Eubacteriaceae bacterium]|nr:ABC transporter substrate-binding protein [Eubacteriaceae bacterium]